MKNIQQMKAVRIHSLKSKPYGLSWSRWAEEWWKWCYSRPSEDPLYDVSADSLTHYSKFRNVCFLSGTFGGVAKRKCEIPKGHSIFFPLINDLISFATDPLLQNESELRMYAKADLDETSIPPSHVTVDGVEIPNIGRYRIQTRVFDIVLPPRKPNSTEAGSWFSSRLPVSTRAVSDGYWIFLKPLAIGAHEIEFVGEKLQFDRKIRRGIVRNVKVPKFRVEVTYQIEII